MRRANAQFIRRLSGVLEELCIQLSAEQIERLHQHYATLQHWNQRINLTALSDPWEIAERHFGESLFLAKELRPAPASVLDVGSGAGFPGLPIGVFHPLCSVTLLEPVNKKVAFLKEVSRPLTNVSVLQGRLEQVEGTFEWATVRGVATLPIMRELRDRAGRVALLTTHRGSEELRSKDRRWQKPIQLPWGRERVLLLGRLNVPHGT